MYGALLDCELFYVELLFELNKSKTDVLYCDWFLIYSLIEIRQGMYSFMCVIYFRILSKH
jgi:hypothetical protein